MKTKFVPLLLSIIILSMAAGAAMGNDLRESPPDVASALVVKLLSFEKKLAKSDKITIYVLADYEVADHLGKAVGKKVGSATISEIVVGTQVPKSSYSVLIIGDESKRNECQDYCRSNKVLSISRDPEQVEKGVSLGIGIGLDNKPKVIINLTASAEEGLDWNPAILKSAKIVK